MYDCTLVPKPVLELHNNTQDPTQSNNYIAVPRTPA